MLEMFSAFYSNVCVFIDFISRFIYIHFKLLEHIHKCYFEAIVLCISYIAFLRAYYSGVAEFCWRCIALVVISCAFTLEFRHLGL